MSDSKKLDTWAFVISLGSIFISGLALWYSNKQVILTAGQVKAYVQVADVKLVEPLADTSLVRLQLKAKNFGQTAAVNVQGDMDYAENEPDSTGEGSPLALRHFGSMGPGLERTVILHPDVRTPRNWPTPSPYGGTTIFFFGTIWYTDDTTGENRKDDWCYELEVKTEDDLKKRTNLEPCDNARYESTRDLRKNPNEK